MSDLTREGHGNYEMSQQRRELMLRAMDGVSELSVLMYQISLHTRCDQILRWCVNNQKTGRELLGLLKTDCAGSMLLFMKHVVKRLDRDAEIRPIFAGRDYLTG